MVLNIYSAAILDLIFIMKDIKKVGSANLMFQMILFGTTMMALNLQAVKEHLTQVNEMNFLFR